MTTATTERIRNAMLIEKDVLTVEVAPTGIYYNPAGSTNPLGLLRIFNQYTLEAYGEDAEIPEGFYKVSRVKWPFRKAVYRVQPIS